MVKSALFEKLAKEDSLAYCINQRTNVQGGFAILRCWVQFLGPDWWQNFEDHRGRISKIHTRYQDRVPSYHLWMAHRRGILGYDFFNNMDNTHSTFSSRSSVGLIRTSEQLQHFFMRRSRKNTVSRWNYALWALSDYCGCRELEKKLYS